MDFSRIVLLDGAMGTEIIKRGLDPKADNSILHPDTVLEIHKHYIASGSNMITTNTFLANRIYCQTAGIKRDIRKSNIQSATLARKAASGQSVFIAGDIGPSGQFVEPYGDLSKEDLYANYKEQAEALAAGGVDGFLIETQLDAVEAFTALEACRAVADLPVIVSFSMNTTSNGARTIMGQPVEELVRLSAEKGALALGCNCVHPEDLIVIVEELTAATNLAVLGQPNAGQPQVIDGVVNYDMNPNEFAYYMQKVLAAGATIVGGCCGTTPDHINALKSVMEMKGEQ